jgi:hypothetical protein
MLSRGMQGALSALALSVVLVGAVPLLNDDADWPGWMVWPLALAVGSFWLSVLAVLVVAVRDWRRSRVPVAPAPTGTPAGSRDLPSDDGR